MFESQFGISSRTSSWVNSREMKVQVNMPKINTGSSHDSSKLFLDAEFSSASDIEIVVGDGYDMSLRQIKILERDASSTALEITKLRDLVAQLKAQLPDDPKVVALGKEAGEIAVAANRMQQERKWYSVSTKGLIEAAGAVGSAASPILKSALGLIKMLSEIEASSK